MIKVSGLKVDVGCSIEDIRQTALKKLRANGSELLSFDIEKMSLDARDKSNIKYVCSVICGFKNEKNILRNNSKNPNVILYEKKEYTLPKQGTEKMLERPCVIGSGPAGLFCAYMLAQNGYKPILIERGEDVDRRIKTVQNFWNGGKLNPDSNIQFGEGGAGTFSDGKLNTGVKDSFGYNAKIRQLFVKYGAPENIIYDAKPHVGTDNLCNVVKKMRQEIINWGGDVFFETQLVGLKIKEGKIYAIEIKKNSISDDNQIEENISVIPCEKLILAIGHSARDTFKMLHGSGLDMQAKAFAVGIRVEHSQNMINVSQYGEDYQVKYKGKLPPADYKLTYRAKDGRGVYSFCMCPGGYVVNSSSIPGRLCINGMSYCGRNGENANSAIVVSVGPEDFKSDNVFAGMYFQESLEEKAFNIANGKIPTQRLEDFIQGKKSEEESNVKSCKRGLYEMSDLNMIFPDFLNDDIKEAFEKFGKIITGFDSPDTLLSAVESRTSSPIRIIRDESLQSNIKGIYPCGEGAGYAGGIMSAAMDGIKVFEEIYRRYLPPVV